MEKHLNIPTSDGFEIQGILNWKKKSQKLLIFIHGLSGDMYESHYYNAKEYFIERGYEVFRFNLYDGGEKNRKLAESSISTHSTDIEYVCEHLSQTYSSISLISHSLGGPSVIGMKRLPQNIKKCIFWDPAFENTGIEKTFIKMGEVFLFLPKNGKALVVSEEMVQNRKEDHIDTLKSFPFPYKNMFIVHAENGGHLSTRIQTDILKIETYIIKGANHGFTQEGKYKELFERTLEFIEK